jgi:hypothetical protein
MDASIRALVVDQANEMSEVIAVCRHHELYNFLNTVSATYPAFASGSTPACFFSSPAGCFPLSGFNHDMLKDEG